MAARMTNGIIYVFIIIVFQINRLLADILMLIFATYHIHNCEEVCFYVAIFVEFDFR